MPSPEFIAARGTVHVVTMSEPFEVARDEALVKAGYVDPAPRFRSRILKVITQGSTRRFRIIRAGKR